MQMILAGAALMGAAMGSASAQEILPTQSARFICETIDGTGRAAAPCEYSGWDETITTTLEMTGPQARDLCQNIAAMTASNDMNLAGWTLHIRSPYSGESSIAFCPLG